MFLTTSRQFIVALITPRMLEAITFGTFYFFLGKSDNAGPAYNTLTRLAFCVVLIVWVFFFVPETKGVRIEEMDKLFGGNQGEADMNRMATIRHQLGVTSDGSDLKNKVDMEIGVSEVEKI